MLDFGDAVLGLTEIVTAHRILPWLYRWSKVTLASSAPQPLQTLKLGLSELADDRFVGWYSCLNSMVFTASDLLFSI
jgi:hypothetical protein